MKDPRSISIKDFTYPLPEERIAKYPLTERDSSRLLIYKKGKITEDVYRNIVNHLPENSFLVFNNTKVVEARLLFKKASGGGIEIFCLDPHERYADITTAFLQKEKVLWQCLIGGASKWKHGQALEKKFHSGNDEYIIRARFIEKRTDCFVIELSWDPPAITFAEILHHAGVIPLPPYIKRNTESVDAERYQTIYASHDGSVAAPTAGLHFTDDIFNSFREKNIQSGFVTLHVGAGTFRPVKTETIGNHEMHSEYIVVSRKFIEELKSRLNDTVIAVGTTSLRTIESLFWLGIKASRNPHIRDLSLDQWECYDPGAKVVSAEEALAALLTWMRNNNRKMLVTKTQIMITPGYIPGIVNALVTNFHQPQSTLLLLVAALIGDNWKRVYEFALQNDYRFLSYGDGSLLWVDKN
jgi:S-adenosylmethionine:tRNA ribosyltransferase-isomerase